MGFRCFSFLEMHSWFYDFLSSGLYEGKQPEWLVCHLPDKFSAVSPLKISFWPNLMHCFYSFSWYSGLAVRNKDCSGHWQKPLCLGVARNLYYEGIITCINISIVGSLVPLQKFSPFLVFIMNTNWFLSCATFLKLLQGLCNCVCVRDCLTILWFEVSFGC